MSLNYGLELQNNIIFNLLCSVGSKGHGEKESERIYHRTWRWNSWDSRYG